MAYGNQHYESTHRHQVILSQHARKRAQKRGIDQSAVRLVMAFGKKKFDAGVGSDI